MSSPPPPASPGDCHSVHLGVTDASEGAPCSIPARCRITYPFQRPTSSGWIATPVSHVFTAAVPGFLRDEIKVEVERGRMLVITFELKDEHDRMSEERVTDTSQSRPARPFPGSFKYVTAYRMPLDTVDLDATTAVLENEVLTVTVPRVEYCGSATVRSVVVSGR